MFTRISSAAVLLAALAACDEGPEPLAGSPIECALGGANVFAADCTMERAEDDDTSILIVRHPDGGFRRFTLGNGIRTADGAEQLMIEDSDFENNEGFIEISVGNDRYRLPVKVYS